VATVRSVSSTALCGGSTGIRRSDRQYDKYRCTTS
jgi:hypothetical protein